MSNVVVAQKNVKTSQASKIQPYPDANIAVYKNALSLNDYTTAIQALHYIIATNNNPVSYADTLAILYMQAGLFVPASLLSNVQLSNYGYSNIRMGIKAQANKNLNNNVVAIECYGILFENTKNQLFGFEKLQLEYGLKRLKESVITANELINIIPETDSTKVQVSKLDNKNIQIVGLKAGVYNLLGAIYLELKEKNLALQALNNAVVLEPNFEQAKSNLIIANTINK